MLSSLCVRKGREGLRLVISFKVCRNPLLGPALSRTGKSPLAGSAVGAHGVRPLPFTFLFPRVRN